MLSKTKNLLFPALTIVVFFIFLEAILIISSSLGLFKFQKLYSVQDVSSEIQQHSQEIERLNYALKGQSPPKSPHPYFGYVYNHTKMSVINKQGFEDFKNFGPKKENEFVIGIFGGSVAKNFGIFQSKNTMGNRNNFLPQLKKILNLPINKKLVIYNFGLSSHKQPQQFFISSFYSNLINLAINIDGFNEVKTTNLSDSPAYFPQDSQIFFTSAPERHLYYWTLYDSIRKKKKIKGFLSNGFISNFQLPIVFGAFYRSYLNRKIKKIYTRNFRNVQTSDYSLEGKTLEKKILNFVKIWQNFTKKQYDFLNSQNINSFYFIQPNQYVPNSKTPTKQESTCCYSDTYYQKIIPIGYRLLAESVKLLNKKGVPVFDLSKSFEGAKKTLYIDDCCHFNADGNQILEDQILRAISENIE